MDKKLVICDTSEMPEERDLESALHPKRMRMRQPSNPAPLPSPSLAPPPSPSLAPPSSTSFVPLQSPLFAPSPSPSTSTAPPSPWSCFVPSPVMLMECSGQSASSLLPTSATQREEPAPTAPSSLPASPTQREESATTAPSWLPASPMQREESAAAVPSSLPVSPTQREESAPIPPSSLPASSTQHATCSRQNLQAVDFDYFLGSDDDTDESDDEECMLPRISRVAQSVLETSFGSDAKKPELAADPALPSDPAPGDVPPTATDQPRSWYEFEWRAFPNPQIPPESRRETFSQSNVGPTTPFGDPYDIFVDIWDRQLMEHIASNTNKYAQQVAAQVLHSHDLHPNSCICQWQDTTVDELYLYFAIMLAMGVVFKSEFEEYWDDTPGILYTPGFAAHMTLNRFILLNKCLHFSDNDDMCALELDYSEARLFKIQPLLTHLNKKFQAMYIPSQNLCLDKSILMWKSWRASCQQFISNKIVNRGIKTYEIRESQTGYLWRFEIHAHKKSPPHHYEDPLEASTPSIVLRLTKGLEHKGYTLWMDSFYNSPCLARRLKSLGFDCVGTLRTGRKFVPQALHSLDEEDITKGQVIGFTSGDVDVMVWRDAMIGGRRAAISTYHGNDVQQTVQGSTKLTLMSDYMTMMGGLDKKDNLLAMYPIERIRTKVWYKKMFRRLLNISVLNAYIIHQHTSHMDHHDFRMFLIKKLLKKHGTPSLIPPVPIQKKTFDVTHRIDEFPLGKHQPQRRFCTICKKLVRTFCTGCGNTVCISPCFLMIHS